MRQAKLIHQSHPNSDQRDHVHRAIGGLLLRKTAPIRERARQLHGSGQHRDAFHAAQEALNFHADHTRRLAGGNGHMPDVQMENRALENLVEETRPAHIDHLMTQLRQHMAAGSDQDVERTAEALLDQSMHLNQGLPQFRKAYRLARAAQEWLMVHRYQ
jgi:hypothetical protein